MRNIILLGLAMSGSAIAAVPKLTPDQQLAKLTRGATPTGSTHCINLPMANDSQTIDGFGILYRIGRTYYLNRFDGGCPLTRFDTLITRVPSTQLCRGDSAQVVEAGTRIPRGSCIYGDFQTFERAR